MTVWFDRLAAFFHRIPPSVIALLLGAIFAYTYFHLQKDDQVAVFLKDKMWDFLLVFILVTRFSVLILHPSLVWNFNLYYVLAQPPAEGWLVGLAVAVLAGVRLWLRNKIDNGPALYQMVQAVLWGSIPYFLYKALWDSAPYMWLDLARLMCAVIIVAANRSVWFKEFGQRHPHRLWGLIGLGLLLSSLAVPPLHTIGPLAAGQWAELALCLAAILMEAHRDLAL